MSSGYGGGYGQQFGGYGRGNEQNYAPREPSAFDNAFAMRQPHMEQSFARPVMNHYGPNDMDRYPGPIQPIPPNQPGMPKPGYEGPYPTQPIPPGQLPKPTPEYPGPSLPIPPGQLPKGGAMGGNMGLPEYMQPQYDPGYNPGDAGYKSPFGGFTNYGR